MQERDEIDVVNDLAAQVARKEAAIYRAIEYGEEETNKVPVD